MRSGDLLGARITDETGVALGIVRDLLLDVPDDSGVLGADGWSVRGVVVGSSEAPLDGLWHRWGLVTGRSRGPWALRRVARASRRSGRVVRAEDVVRWGPGAVVVRADRSVPLTELPEGGAGER